MEVRLAIGARAKSQRKCVVDEMRAPSACADRFLVLVASYDHLPVHTVGPKDGPEDFVSFRGALGKVRPPNAVPMERNDDARGLAIFYPVVVELHRHLGVIAGVVCFAVS